MVYGSRATVVSVLFPVLATLCVAARLVARLKLLRNPGWEDGIIVISLMSSITVSVFVCLQVKYGLGSHFDTLNGAQITNVLKFLWASIPFYNLSLTLTKISLVLQYTRVFVGKRIRLACWMTMGFIVTYGIWSVVSAIFNCVPIHAFWDLNFTGGRCLDKKFMWFFNASLNLVTDIVLVALPMPVLKNLQLPKKQKIGLMCIFGLGGFICLVSILRLHSLYIISISTDPTYDNTDAAIWSIIEMNVGIICGSLATLRPLITHLFPRLLNSNPASLPTHNRTFSEREVQETYHAGGGHRDSHSQRHGSKVLKSGHFQLTDLPRSHAATIKMTVRRGETVPMSPVPDENGRIRGGRVDREPGNDIIVTTAVRQDVERRPSESESEQSLMFKV